MTDQVVSTPRPLLRRTVQEVEEAARQRIDRLPELLALASGDRHFSTGFSLRVTEHFFRAT